VLNSKSTVDAVKWMTAFWKDACDEGGLGWEVYSKYVITDMFAKAVQGMKPEEAVEWAEGELKKVYEA